jgi:hypothetical protein
MLRVVMQTRAMLFRFTLQSYLDFRAICPGHSPTRTVRGLVFYPPAGMGSEYQNDPTIQFLIFCLYKPSYSRTVDLSCCPLTVCKAEVS